MTLTTEDKHKIKEEEEYRQKIREQEQYRQSISNKLVQPKKSSLLVWILFIAILAIPTAFGIYMMRYEQPTSKPMETTSTTQTTSVVGKYAFNKTSGTYRGIITGVKLCTTNNQISCYVVEREGSSRPEEAPIDNTYVRETR